MTIIEHSTRTEKEVRKPVHFVLSKTGKAANYEHNHDVPTVDDFKRSRGMLETAAKYVSKGFKAADVFRALRAQDQPEIHQLFLNAGGGPLKRRDVLNAALEYRRNHPDLRLGGNKSPVPDQVAQLLQWRREENLPHHYIISRRRKDGEASQGVEFGSASRLKALRRRGWLTLLAGSTSCNSF